MHTALYFKIMVTLDNKRCAADEDALNESEIKYKPRLMLVNRLPQLQNWLSEYS
jgi:hypothetical protein